MVISTKGRYALRVMVDLAEQPADIWVPLEQIAQRQGISKKYLELILKALVSSGLLIGRRGKSGGYRLTRPADAYPVAEVLEATGEVLSPVACLAPGAPSCPRRSACKTLPLWARFDRMVHAFFAGVTVADLAMGNLPDLPGAVSAADPTACYP